MTHHDEHTHEFDCRQCGAHLDSREELDRHNQEKHGQQASGGSDRGSFGSEGGGSQYGSTR